MPYMCQTGRAGQHPPTEGNRQSPCLPPAEHCPVGSVHWVVSEGDPRQPDSSCPRPAVDECETSSRVVDIQGF